MDSIEQMPRQNEDLVERIRRQSGRSINLVIAAMNVIVFLLVTMTGGSENYRNMMRWGVAYAPAIQSGEVWRLFTCMFLHFGVEHLLNNMVLLLFLGDYLERYVGKVGYLLIYLGGGLFGSFLSYQNELGRIAAGQSPVVSAGASGAVFAVTGAMVILLMFHKGHLEDLSLRRMLSMVLVSIYVGFESAGIDNLAHIGGFLAGAGILILIYPFIRKMREGREKGKYRIF